ncbi:hypothetical protein VTO42DRAFT_6273 [Malbranchea cinnamomea]
MDTRILCSRSLLHFLSLARCTKTLCRHSSSKRWQARQSKDIYRREAAVRGLRSRAAFKLLQIHDRYRIFKPGQTVVDLGYAPGSWSQVAADLTKPNGRVVGVDIIPAQPPKGVSTIQGNFLSPRVQAYVQEFLRNPERGRVRAHLPSSSDRDDIQSPSENRYIERISCDDKGYIDRQRETTALIEETGEIRDTVPTSNDSPDERTVDVVLSDMLMNTSGLAFRDHVGSMDLCSAALAFSYNVLCTGGHFVCKFYQGPEDKKFETQLKALFEKVHREKPDSSRSDSKEAYFIGLRRKHDAPRSEVFTRNGMS